MTGQRRWCAALALALSWSCREQSAAQRAEPVAPASGAPTHSLGVGALAPDFTALSQTGYSVSLGQFLNKPVAVYFCPGGLDPSCTGLMTALRDKWLTLNQRLGMLLFILPGGYNENRAHASRHELPFLLLADTAGAILSSYGLGPASARAAPPTGVLVGTDRKIQRVFSGPLQAEHLTALRHELP